MASPESLRHSMDDTTTESPQASGATQAWVPPAASIKNSQDEGSMDPPPPRHPLQRSRTMSYASRKQNRLSLSFPVSTGLNAIEPNRETPTSSIAPSFPTTPADISSPPSPTQDSSGFLVVLAGQERRVLDLKEELQKAESNLTKLKRQWAMHEATKKRAENQSMEQMQPLVSVVAEGRTSNEEQRQRHSVELDKRKALLNGAPREPRRKVFTGGHTRALSLLSPDKSAQQAFPLVKDVKDPEAMDGTMQSTALPDTNPDRQVSPLNPARHSYQGGVTHGAKQIAEDVKTGLWNFLEDLRQATVGDEAINGTLGSTSSDGSSSKTLKRASTFYANERNRRGQSLKDGQSGRTWDALSGENVNLVDAIGGLFQEGAQSTAAHKTPVKNKLARAQTAATPNSDYLDDDWSSWDSPVPKSPRWSGSSTHTDGPATPSNSNADRIVKVVGQSGEQDEVQWPVLEKLTPSNVRKTMSTMMKEWEKSLSLPPDEQHDHLTGPLENETKARSTSKRRTMARTGDA